jgi:hypothetical protein
MNISEEQGVDFAEGGFNSFSHLFFEESDPWLILSLELRLRCIICEVSRHSLHFVI